MPPDVAAPETAEGDAHPADVSGVEDDRLRLLFTCCHPAIGQAAQMALALRTLCGLSTRELERLLYLPVYPGVTSADLHLLAAALAGFSAPSIAQETTTAQEASLSGEESGKAVA